MPQRRAPRAKPSDLARRASREKLSTFKLDQWAVDYAGVMKAAPLDLSERAAYLSTDLPFRWRDTYLALAIRPTNVLRVECEGFAYLFDWYSRFFDEAQNAADLGNEDRLVAAFGFSKAGETERNTARQRGWIGPTNKHLGSDRDKGHFVPHSLGGGLEINLFVQLRDLNRGWSAAGKTYRAMEAYCLSHPGRFFFNRPIYADGTAQPALLELGLLRTDGRSGSNVLKISDSAERPAALKRGLRDRPFSPNTGQVQLPHSSAVWRAAEFAQRRVNAFLASPVNRG